MNIFVCPACKLQYKSNRALSTHQSKTPYCYHFITSLPSIIQQQITHINNSEHTQFSDDTNSLYSISRQLHNNIINFGNNSSDKSDIISEDTASIEGNNYFKLISFITLMKSYTK